jgi:acyl carrier protein
MLRRNPLNTDNRRTAHTARNRSGQAAGKSEVEAKTPRPASRKTLPGPITLRGFLSMKTALRRILSESARLDVPPQTLADDADLYAAGLSSLATVHLMLAIEDEFGIEIPDRMLTRRLFSSIDSLAAAVSELQQAKAAA